MIHTKSKDNTLEIFTVLMTVMFLLIAFKYAYVRFCEGPSEGDFFLLTMNTVWIFAIYEIPFIIAIYSGGSLLSEAMPGIWAYGKSICIKIRSFCSAKTVNPDNKKTAVLLTFPVHEQETQLQVKNVNNPVNGNYDEATNSDSLQEVSSVITVLSDEIVNYTYGSFGDVMTKEQIEKFLDNFRNLNNGGAFEVIEKIKLPEGVLLFDLFHFCWNVCKRIYLDEQCNTDFRDRTALLIKSSFPLTVKSSLRTINKTMTNDDKPYSIPVIKLGKPLDPIALNPYRKPTRE